MAKVHTPAELAAMSRAEAVEALWSVTVTELDEMSPKSRAVFRRLNAEADDETEASTVR